MRSLPVVLLALLFVGGVGCVRSGFDPRDDDVISPTNNPSALVQVSDLGVQWATPRMVEWTWSMSGVAGDLDVIVFAVGESLSDVVNQKAPAQVVRFERALQPWADTFDLSFIARQVIGELQPDTTYVAQLIAVDTEGLTSATDVIKLATPPIPPSEIVVFSEDPTAGYSIPAELLYSSAAPFKGDNHYEYFSDCGTEAACFDWLRRQDVGIDLSAISQKAFAETAYIEFGLAHTNSLGLGGAVRLYFDGPDDGDRIWFSRDMLLEGGGAYRVYQVPLRELIGSFDPDPPTLPYTVLQDGLFEFGVGGPWVDGTTVRWDEVRFVW